MNQPAPRFSLIIPAYNVAAYIGTCLDSLLIDATLDCEVIVVNDGSMDETPAIVRSYDDPRLVLVNKENGGPGDARNVGIDRARGTYLMFVDGDDWLEADTIPAFEQALSESPEADLLVFGFNEIYGATKFPHHCTADFWDITDSPCNKLFHRDLFDGLRFDPKIWYEDLAIVPCLFARARNPKTLDKLLYNYRRDRETSIMNTIDFERVFDLPLAAQHCLERIRADEESGRIAPTKPRFGDDWEERFITIEIFIPGVLHRSRRIADRKLRRKYIADMMARLPKRDRIRLDIVRRQYGLKMCAGSLLYRHGQYRLAHWLLHDTGAVKRWGVSWLNRGDRANAD